MALRGMRRRGHATADADGRWSLASPHPAPAGKTELRLDELAADGSVARHLVQSFEPTVNRAGTAPAAGTYTVERGNSLRLIARSFYGRCTRYTAIYDANRTHTRDPDLIYPGQVVKLPHS